MSNSKYALFLITLYAITFVSSVTFVNASQDQDYIRREFSNSKLKYEKNLTNSILNAQVASSDLQDLISLRKTNGIYYPEHIEAYFLGEEVYFNIIWKMMTTSFSWKIIFGLNSSDYVTTRSSYVSAGYAVKQVENYAKTGINGNAVLYSAIFYVKSYWESGTTFFSSSKLAFDDTYCCGDSSRWTVLADLGYKPTSISIIRNPSTGNYTVSDAWNSVDVGLWTGSLEISAYKLKSSLINITDSAMIPVYIRSWEKLNDLGVKEVVYTYLAYEGDGSGYTFSMGDSRSGFDLLMDVAKVVPVCFATHEIKEGVDSSLANSGEMYFSVWNFQNSTSDSYI